MTFSNSASESVTPKTPTLHEPPLQGAYLYCQGSKHVLSSWTNIGSAPDCDLVLTESSARQARVEKKGNDFLLRDLRSGLPTQLNQKTVSEAILQNGDEISIGNQVLYFVSANQRPHFSLQSKSPTWSEQLSRVSSAATTEYPILILGPTGSGKEVLAKAIHHRSDRSQGPFVSVNCGALAENLIESELFGHTKGSFTGAISDRKGAFEAARGGTLFLDEIGDLPLSLQAKLLRALENKEIKPVGADIIVQTDVRIVAATHQDIRGKIQNQEFRADLYFRLNVICVQTPSLQNRMEDFDDLLFQFARELRVRFSAEAIAMLKGHRWPGNVRELRNCVTRAAALFPYQTIELAQISQLLDEPHPVAEARSNMLPGNNLPLIKELERELILRRLAVHGGNQRRTAADLRIPKSTLHDRLRDYNIDPKTFREKESFLKESLRGNGSIHAKPRSLPDTHRQNGPMTDRQVEPQLPHGLRQA